MSEENPPPPPFPRLPPLLLAALGFQKLRDITYGGQRVNKALLNFPLAFMSERDQACAELRRGRESRIPVVFERRTNALHVSGGVRVCVRAMVRRCVG